MRLNVDGDTYWASLIKVRKNARDFDIHVGNPNGRPKPCIRFTLYKNTKGSYDVVIQDIEYHSTCSSTRPMQRKAGTIKMVQGALKAIISYLGKTQVHSISFTDESRYEHPSNGYIPLPEKYALFGKPTWYQQHFGAIPTKTTNNATENVLRAYRDASKIKVADTHIVDLAFYKHAFASMTIREMMQAIGDNITEMHVSSILHALNLPPLSGTSWSIPVNKVAQYSINEAAFEDVTMGGGDNSLMFLPTELYSFKKNHRAYLAKQQK